MAKTYRIGVVGTGTIAEMNHIPGFKGQPDAEVVAVCDTVAERAHDVAQRHSIPQVFTSWEEMVAGDTVDAISIATPNAFHAPISIGAMRAGKHVLCEKPPALNAAQAEEVSRAAKETGRTYMACQNLRFDSERQVLREMITRGELGEIYYAKAAMLRRRGSAGGWFTRKELSGGGALVDIGVHALDYTRWIMGNPRPVSVMGFATQKIGSYRLAVHQSWTPAELRGGVQRPQDWAGDADEMAVAMIRFDTGAVMTLEVSWTLNVVKETSYTEIFGTKGGAAVSPLVIATEENGYIVDKIIKVPGTSYTETHSRAIRHFLDSITNGTEPLASADQAVVTMRILDAIYKSTETGQSVSL